MSRMSYGYRKDNKQGWGKKLLRQAIFAVVILLFVIFIKKLNLAVAEQAVQTLQYQMTRDYTAQEIQDTAVGVFSQAGKLPRQIVGAVKKSQSDMEFVPPTEEAATVSVFGMKKGGKQGEQRVFQPSMKFSSAKELQVYAVAGGTVTEINGGKEQPMSIHISHGNNRDSVYEGCSQVYVQPLQRVKKGQLIASVLPETGEALCFQLWVDHTPVNPADYIAF